MGQESDQNSDGPKLISSSRPFFTKMVEEAVQQRRIKAPVATQGYLVGLLEHYMVTRNLFASSEANKQPVPGTLAETFLIAANAEPAVRQEMLKRLGDTSLYISGFFGDSLHRKVVDVDYYAEIGGTAYGTLAASAIVREAAPVYRDLAERFLDYVEVLTLISQQAMVQSDQDLLRLYNRYMATGSKLAAEQLREKGIFTPIPPVKTAKQ
ncbi:MAG: hypothetical protein AB7N80_01465 [Bdellovibrionales bacterium]